MILPAAFPFGPEIKAAGHCPDQHDNRELPGVFAGHDQKRDNRRLE